MRQRGFTLVEMMAVVSIIGIAGGVAAFAMSEQIVDARSKAETRVVVERLRAEHRAAREQMVGLKVTAEPHVVRYQHTRGEDCAVAVGDAREVSYDKASLRILSGESACFNARGEPDPPGGRAGGTIIIGGGATTATTSGQTATGTIPEPIVIAVEAPLGENGHILVPLRIDRAGIADLPPMRVTEAGLIEVLNRFEANPEKLITDVALSTGGEFDFKTDPITTQDPSGAPVDVLNTTGMCTDQATGLLVPCTQ